MKTSDYIIDFFVKRGVTTCFGISGGACLHLHDSAYHNKEMRMIYAAHEQGATAMADGFARISGSPGLCMVTSGPGATNTLTSICNAFYDSIPIFLITGQVSTNRLMSEKDRQNGMRQKGFQETPTVEIFRPVTKEAIQIKHPADIVAQLEKLWRLTQDGRPGPVLMDIPDDLQRATLDVL